ncbi:MAG TPA: hypothetical protein PK733_19960, partial [Clostridiales bacterium]|nr:hypothetical protein [Clostridiales bacterium]
GYIDIALLRREPIDGRLKKKGIYMLNDNLIRFWYRCVPRNMSRIQEKLGKLIYKKIIAPFLGMVLGESCIILQYSIN